MGAAPRAVIGGVAGSAQDNKSGKDNYECTFHKFLWFEDSTERKLTPGLGKGLGIGVARPGFKQLSSLF